MKHRMAVESSTGVAGAGLAGGGGEQVAFAMKGEWLVTHGPGALSWTEVGQIIGIIYCTLLTIKMIYKAVVWVKDRIKSTK